MTDEKLPDPASDAVKPPSNQADTPAQPGSDSAQKSEPGAQPETIDQMLEDLIDDTKEADLYHLLSIC